MYQRGTARLLRFAMWTPAVVLLFGSVNTLAQGIFPGSLLVRLTPDASIANVAQEYGLTVIDDIQSRNVYEVSVQDPSVAYATQCFLNLDSRVRYCEAEAAIDVPEVQADPFHIAFDISADSTAYVNQPAYGNIGLGNSGSSTNSCSTAGDSVSPVTIAVLDTGADLSHVDLAGRMLAGYNTLNPRSEPLDIPDGQTNVAVGHGTMIAGIIVRVSPNAMIMPIRVINGDGLGSMMKVVKGIHYAIRHGAGVINMSFETNVFSLALLDALSEAYDSGIVLVASAGNDSTSAPRFPASFSNVIGVASVEDNDTLSTFSNFGVNALLVAPGSSIRSTFWNGGFATWSGTSFAAPFATAEAAEILARNQFLSPGQVTYTMLTTANSVDYLNPGYANMLGAGIINLQAAITGE